VIAVFYTADLSLGWLPVAALACFLIVLLRRMRGKVIGQPGDVVGRQERNGAVAARHHVADGRRARDGRRHRLHSLVVRRGSDGRHPVTATSSVDVRDAQRHIPER
jgi:hypothetical protein